MRKVRHGMRNEYPCGCWISCDNASVYLIEWCPLHKAASDLLEACKAVYSDAINHQHRHNNKMFPKRAEAIHKLQQAIAKAKDDKGELQ